MSKAGGEPAAADAEKKYVVSATQGGRDCPILHILEANQGVNV